ncbi:autotransporter outer membrane beta-barrel domain-containing protein [Achromobacter seleniivolatilans]|uniref:Autotransporter outer membrane beta-barrel domain-containing protein n=1 Tax=Achromobacter seleniivolatilans TaxID=3047478 RepID=A0ABY9LUT3_9BURK|nr:autotransporter outer membrane beta-barrel domain-containing protein [Achromobacter sp. R39]WMD18312.1 autotransporter outer membrane beta-barrel domain-containing protein [Achromobacter sp. R39]
MPKARLRSLTAAIRLALAWLLLPSAVAAQSYDQTIDTDQSSTVFLSKPGTTALIDTGVKIAPASGDGVVVRFGDYWEITNRGTIQPARGNGIFLGGKDNRVTNLHVISGGNHGIQAPNGGTVINGPVASIFGYTGLAGSGSLALNNAGTIEGIYNGVNFSIYGDEIFANIVNSGAILGTGAGIYLIGGGGNIRNLNGGRIFAAGPAGDGISMLAGGNSITNDAGGTIEGSRVGISGTDLNTRVSVINSGAVVGGTGAGVRSFGGGPISNLAGGSITGSGGVAYVRSLYSVTDVLINGGNIAGTYDRFVAGSGWDAGNGTGVYVGGASQPGAIVKNLAGGVVQGSVYGIYSGAARFAVDAGPVTVSNMGTIQGHTGISLNGANGTVINHGIITGSGGAAIEFDQNAPYANSLTLATGSVLNGNVQGGAGTNDLILLGINSEDLSRFLQMQTLSMQGEDWTLTGDGGFAARATVTRGTLRIDGKLTTPITTVQPGAELAGSGTIAGDVVNAGTLAPGGSGNPIGTLTITGDLTLAQGAVLEYQLGQAERAGGALNDLINVGGNLTLDGTLNVSVAPGGTYGPGLYRLLNYDGALTNNGLELGRMPEGSDNTLLTTIPGQVNLVNRAGLRLTFWDGDSGPKHNGAVDGGDGRWHGAASNDNWTSVSGAVNAAYDNGSFATFAGVPGVVEVDNSGGGIVSSGMQFATDGYRVQGDPISLSLSNNILRVGDGSAAGAQFRATIAAPLDGAGGIEKSDLGTLVLEGANAYTGSTIIAGGVLQAGAADVFAQSHDVAIHREGTLDLNGHDQTARQLSGSGLVLLDGATLTADNASSAHSSDFQGVFRGAGSLVKTGAGMLTLAGSESQVGAVNVQQGTLRFEHGGAFSITGNYVTRAGANTVIGEKATTLSVGGSFVQDSGASLTVTLGASPEITAQTATLDGHLTVTGFDAGNQPARASGVLGQTYTMLSTSGGISGDFTSNSLPDLGPDYLPATGAISADGKDYNLGFRLAWTEGGQALGTGTFTLAKNTAFDVDLELGDQSGPFASDWDGRSLVKGGDGLLVLSSSENTYSGSTSVNGGTLQAGTDNVIARSSDVMINSGGTFDLNGHDQTVNRLAGAGEIALGDARLTARNAAAEDNSTFSGRITGPGSLTKTGAGTLTLSGDTAYRGETHVQGGQLVLDGVQGGARLQSGVTGQPGSELALRNGAVLTGTVNVLDVSVDAASAWNMTSNPAVRQLRNAGAIGFAQPPSPISAVRTLTVNDLTGQGGIISLYAGMGKDGMSADHVVIDGGQASGVSRLQIQNAGGLGDRTTGGGIPVVVTANGGTTTAAAFELSAPVVAGPYRYSLLRGSSEAPEDWFLVTGASGGAIDYRAETSLYSALPTQALRYGDAVMGSFHERRGAGADLGLGQARHVWTRVMGQNDRNRGASNGVLGRRVRDEANIAAWQLGGDLYLAPSETMQTRVGMYGAIGQSRGTADHVDAWGGRSRAGTNNFTGYSLGLYRTWLNGQGSYVDAVVQGTYYNVKSRSDTGMALSTSGYGASASLEAGRRYTLAPGVHLQPQAQVTYQHVNLRSASDAASRVKFPSVDTATLRVGARLSKDLQGGGREPGTAWSGIDVLYRAGSRTRTRFSTLTQGDEQLSNDLQGTSVRLQAGVEGQIRRNVSLNARVGVERGLNGPGVTSLNGQVTLQIAF